MTEYHRIGEWPSVLYNRLLSIQSTYGVAPEDPVQNQGSYEESKFVGVFGLLDILTGDSNMQSLYEVHRDYMLGGLDKGYLTSLGTNSPCASDCNTIERLFEIYRITGDSNLYDLLNEIANGFAGIRTDGNNWPRQSDSGYDIFANCLNGTYWGTLNMEATVAAVLVESYYISDMDTYHLSTTPKDIWNIVKWIAIKQLSDGSLPRDNGGSVVESYDVFAAFILSHMYILMKNKGDLTYNGDSLMALIRGILDKHWEYYQSHYGVRNIAVVDENISGAFSFLHEMSVHGLTEEAVKTGLLNSYVWSQGFYRINTSVDYRQYPIISMQKTEWFGDEDIKNAFKRWL